MDVLERTLRFNAGTTISSEGASQITEVKVDEAVEAIRVVHRAQPPKRLTRPVSANLPTKADIAAGRLDAATMRPSSAQALGTRSLELVHSRSEAATLVQPYRQPTMAAPQMAHQRISSRGLLTPSHRGQWASTGDISTRIKSDMELMSMVATSASRVAAERANNTVARVRHTNVAPVPRVTKRDDVAKSAIRAQRVSKGPRASRSWRKELNAYEVQQQEMQANEAKLRQAATASPPQNDNNLDHISRYLWKRGLAKIKIQKALTIRQLRDEAPDHEAMIAADKWDRKHRTYSATSERQHFESKHLDYGLDEAEKDFAKALWEIRRNRYVQPYKPKEVVVEIKERRAAPTVAWDLYKSIWSPRVKWAESHDLYDTAKVRSNRFDKDWTNAMTMGLVKIIMRNDDGDDDGLEDEDGDGIPDEVEEVGEVLWKHNMLLYALFTHYAALSHSLDTLSLNSWTTFVTDCQIVNKSSKFCTLSHLDMIFMQADMLGKKHEKVLAKEQQAAATAANAGRSVAAAPKRAVKDEEHKLSRGEFNIALVLVGINKYVLPGELKDVSDAMDRLLGVVIQSRLGAFVTSDSDVFRRCYCYTEPTCIVLKRHEDALHKIFEFVASYGATGSSNKASSVTLEEWCLSLRALDILGKDLSERDALRCFSWSRMAVVDPQSIKGHVKNSVLPFEGFMEALCRVVPLKALPTERECSDPNNAGRFLLELKQHELDDYNLLIDERRGVWCGDVPDDFPRALEAVISIFTHNLKVFFGRK